MPVKKNSKKWQNGPAKSTINSIMLIAGTVTAESGLGGRCWFKAANVGVDACNVTVKAQIGTTQHHLMYGKKRDSDVSGFLAFGCRAWVYI
jgi:hypothetical protein